jgi:hypothetical protein
MKIILMPWQWLPCLASLVLHLHHLSPIIDPCEHTLILVLVLFALLLVLLLFLILVLVLGTLGNEVSILSTLIAFVLRLLLPFITAFL